MKNFPFRERKRQHFLYEELYEKTRENLLSLIEGGLENLRSCDSVAEASSIHQFLYLEAFWIWMLDYTAGTPIEELAPRLSGIVDSFETWNKVHQIYQQEAAKDFPEYGPYEYAGAPDFSTIFDYENTLQLLSIAILLRDQDSVRRIVNALRSHRGQDGLFEQLISGHVEDEHALSSCVIGSPYTTLLNVYYEEDERASITLLKKYLDEWYPAMRDHPRWYDGHRRIRQEGYAPYYGYWAFEAGATAFILDLDDSQVEQLVYPKDLVDYARQLWAQNR